MKTSFVATVLNEEKSIDKFVRSILNQTKTPDEIIIVDAGSTDKTIERLKQYKKIKIFKKKGNRSVGRNYGISYATGGIILVSDAGCVLDKNWVKYVTEPFKKNTVDVVAGYYAAKPNTAFEEALIPYVFVMHDKVDPKTFLPATRSMAMRKSIWINAGKFDENLSHNEDYAFAQKLKIINANIVFKKKAVVYWVPRSNVRQAFTMFWRFAYGDAEAHILRPKVLLIFIRYLIVLLLLIVASNLKSYFLLIFLIFVFIIYLFWAIFKNNRYVSSLQGKLFLPVLQLVSDGAVISGTIMGFFKNSL